jgi:hypothetical protein
MGIVDGRSKPGDYVELRAESRVLAVVSNCPQTHNPCNGFNLTPIRVMLSGGSYSSGSEMVVADRSAR